VWYPLYTERGKMQVAEIREWRMENGEWRVEVKGSSWRGEILTLEQGWAILNARQAGMVDTHKQ